MHQGTSTSVHTPQQAFSFLTVTHAWGLSPGELAALILWQGSYADSSKEGFAVTCKLLKLPPSAPQHLKAEMCPALREHVQTPSYQGAHQNNSAEQPWREGHGQQGRRNATTEPHVQGPGRAG